MQTAQEYILGIILIFTVIKFGFSSPTWYSGNNGKRYLVELDTKLNWLQANSQCKRRGLQLLEIDSSDKNSQIKDILRKIWGGSKDIWLGYHDGLSSSTDSHRPFYSLSTGVQITYSDWYNRESSTPEEQTHCVQLSNDHNLQWLTVDCSRKNSFICEESKNNQDSDNKRKTIFEANRKISNEFTNLQNSMRQVNENIRHDTFSALNTHLKSTNDIITDVKSSIEAILKKKPFVLALLADSIKTFNTLVVEKEAALAKVAEDTQSTILKSNSQGQNKINELTSKFANSLTSNTNEINRLLGS
ncbi:lectin subunit alpha [Musca domestica]|uniref:Lectin subunit alpha n=1 Tax=Musca domestica TaxID=7370 RepID=A0ABM3UTB5_MUSDO|nr:lectin subunit alpha [Musca domestica]